MSFRVRGSGKGTHPAGRLAKSPSRMSRIATSPWQPVSEVMLGPKDLKTAATTTTIMLPECASVPKSTCYCKVVKLALMTKALMTKPITLNAQPCPHMGCTKIMAPAATATFARNRLELPLLASPPAVAARPCSRLSLLLPPILPLLLLLLLGPATLMPKQLLLHHIPVDEPW